MFRKWTGHSCLIACAFFPTYVVSASVESVRITGNSQIEESDIRIACSISAGVEYSQFDLIAIEECLMLTGVFETVSVSRQDDELVVRVSEIVEEKQTVSLGISLDSNDGILGDFAFESDVLIDGASVYVNLLSNGSDTEALASIYGDDAFFGLGAGLDFLAIDSSVTDIKPYADTSFRLEPYVVAGSEKRQFEAGLGVRKYGFDRVRTEFVDVIGSDHNSTSPYVRLKYSLTNFSDDAALKSTYETSFTQYFWNLGTGREISESNVRLSYGSDFGDGVTFSTTFDAGAVVGLNESELFVIDRFFNDADDIRGFASRGIGPSVGTAIGGDYTMRGSFDLEKELVEMRDIPISAGVFFDYGSVWDVSESNADSADFFLRSSAGLTLSMDFNRMKLSFFLADVVSSAVSDDTQRFGISLRSSY